MSIPKGSEVDAQAHSAGIGGSTAVPSSVPAPCPSGDVPREGSRDIPQKGKIISVPHDWCKSTDSPVPYRIWAWQSSASNLANTVRQTDCRSHVLGSIVNQCYGDEPGTGGGVKSGTNLAECTPLSASPTVRAEGKPMVRYLDKWWMNHKNTWGCLNNSEDMGKYDAPKLQNIDAKLSPIPSREEDQQALANGAQVAQVAIPMETPVGPLPGPQQYQQLQNATGALVKGIQGLAPEQGETFGEYMQRPLYNLGLKKKKNKPPQFLLPNMLYERRQSNKENALALLRLTRFKRRNAQQNAKARRRITSCRITFSDQATDCSECKEAACTTTRAER
ncbi:protein of unknown function [Beijerinckiaceae bacterium RH AL1]|nr:protein of unknown function [Beijerinckiaceae bacterium RH CH11]VVB43888.1 protein of unknown function [Beijerinckiaceae bacterium RH AL8]VVC54050.1 protein of unknown function [Beijerinckiaceae bacterium RH AL1]